MMKPLPWLSRTRISALSLASGLAVLTGVVACFYPHSLTAQTLTFTGATSSVDFGTANLCKPGGFNPSPCGKTITLDYKVTAGGTLGTPKALTLGTPDRDFTVSNGTTCLGGVTAGETCSVNVTFTPLLPGTRPGGVQLVNFQGKVVATTFIYGEGTGPQIGFTPGTVIANVAINASFGFSVIDGEGNLIVSAFTKPYLQKIPAGGGPVTTIPVTPAHSACAVAIDGVGNLYVIDCEGSQDLLKIPAGGGPRVSIGSAFPYINSGEVYIMAADKFGNVLLFGGDSIEDPMPTIEVEIPPGAVTPVVNYFPEDTSILASDPSGDLFTLSPASPQIVEYPAGSDTGKILPITFPPPYHTPSGVSVDPVGNVFADTATLDIAPTGSQYGLLELPLGVGPQVKIPVPTSAESILVGPTGDLYSNGFELQRSVAAPLNFGSLAVGTTKTLPLGITNTGNRPLVLSIFYDSPSYKLTESPASCLKSIAPGTVCTLNVQFTALSEGDHTITLTLGTNGAADANVLLQGIGVK